MQSKYLLLGFFIIFFIIGCDKKEVIKEEISNLTTSYLSKQKIKNSSILNKDFLKSDTSYYTPYEKDRILQLNFNSKKNEVEFSFYTSEGKFLQKEKILKYNIVENDILKFKDEIWQFLVENKQLFLSTKEHLYKLYTLKSKVLDLYDISMIKDKSITIKGEDKTFSFMKNRNYFEVNNNIKKSGYFWEKIEENKFIVLFSNSKENFIEEENIITFDFLDGKIEENAKMRISYYDENLKDFKVETKIIQTVSTLN